MSRWVRRPPGCGRSGTCRSLTARTGASLTAWWRRLATPHHPVQSHSFRPAPVKPSAILPTGTPAISPRPGQALPPAPAATPQVAESRGRETGGHRRSGAGCRGLGDAHGRWVIPTARSYPPPQPRPRSLGVAAGGLSVGETKGPIIASSPRTTCALPRRKKTPPGPMAADRAEGAGPAAPEPEEEVSAMLSGGPAAISPRHGRYQPPTPAATRLVPVTKNRSRGGPGLEMAASLCQSEEILEPEPRDSAIESPDPDPVSRSEYLHPTTAAQGHL